MLNLQWVVLTKENFTKSIVVRKTKDCFARNRSSYKAKYCSGTGCLWLWHTHSTPRLNLYGFVLITRCNITPNTFDTWNVKCLLIIITVKSRLVQKRSTVCIIQSACPGFIRWLYTFLTIYHISLDSLHKVLF